MRSLPPRLLACPRMSPACSGFLMSRGRQGGKLLQAKGRRRTCGSLESLAHLGEGVAAGLYRLGGHAVLGDDERVPRMYALAGNRTQISVARPENMRVR